MKNKNLMKVVLAGFLLTSLPAQGVFAKNAGDVSVKLSNYLGNKERITLSIQGNYYVEGNRDFILNGFYTLARESNQLRLTGNGKNELFTNSFTIVPVEYGLDNTVSIDGRKYVGEMQFRIENNVIRPVNSLPLEDYLIGVVPNEMIPTWHVEALKAQAVSARTYAERYNGQEITDTQLHQVYGGFTWYPNTSKAIQETTGQVLTYNGKLIEALYSSSNGGYIQSNKGAWGGVQLPYLQAKADAFDPQTVFTYTASQAVLTKAFGVKSIESIQVKDYTDGKYVNNFTLTVNGNGTKLNVSSASMRSKLGGMNIKSTYIDSITKSGSDFIFKGKGFGHGVGMSQYGAKSMAEKGYNYQNILSYYYEGAQLTGIDSNGSSLIPNNEPNTNESGTVQTYIVKKGDSLYRIAINHGITLDQLKKWNGLTSDLLNPGVKLIVSKNAESGKIESPTVPKPPVVDNTVKAKTYTVKKGDSLYRIAVNNKITLDELKKMNGLTSDIVNPGKVLIVSKGSQTIAPPTVNTKPNVVAPVQKTYVVKKGDTLYGVSKTYKVSVDNLKKWNSLKNDAIKIGQKLKVSN